MLTMRSWLDRTLIGCGSALRVRERLDARMDQDVPELSGKATFAPADNLMGDAERFEP